MLVWFLLIATTGWLIGFVARVAFDEVAGFPFVLIGVLPGHDSTSWPSTAAAWARSLG